MRLFGIIGYPLGHSFSQNHFTAKFRKENLSDCSYRKFEIASIDLLPSILKSEPDLCGFNVTIPYKVQVIKYLDDIDKTADEIGSVNTVRVTRKNGKAFLKGFNTDALGFRESLLNYLTAIPETAIILGTGGASKSVFYVLTELGIRSLLVSRDSEKGSYSYQTLPGREIANAGLIVNTTPVGMAPAIDKCPPLEYDYLNGNQLLFDLIYNPPVTKFMQKGEERGCLAVNGEEMFLIQAEHAWRIWNENTK